MLRTLYKVSGTLPQKTLCASLYSSVRFLEYSPDERRREEDLRRKVQERYRGMQIPEMTNHEYGHFSSMGINAAAAQQATSSAGGQGFTGFSGMPFQRGGRVDWLMLLTGLALVYFSGKIMLNQLTQGVDGLNMPLWIASVETQAKHLLFAVQFNQAEQKQMRQDFHTARQMNPFVDFFEWVHTQRPEFCCGQRYSSEHVMGILVSALRNGDSTQLATLARTLQTTVSRQGGDSLQRIDDFVDQLQAAGYLLQAVRGFGHSSLPNTQSQQNYQSPAVEAPQYQLQSAGGPQSGIQNALDVNNSETHSSTPFSDRK